MADAYGEKAAAIRVILTIVTVAAGGFLALLFRTDYDLSGIVTIFAIYMFYPKKVKGMGIGVYCCSTSSRPVTSSSMFCGSFLYCSITVSHSICTS